jgi:putative intracellular protease/amidase
MPGICDQAAGFKQSKEDSMADRNVLIVTTSHASLGETGNSTGLWLEELTTPYYALLDGGVGLRLASIAGGEVPIDPNSVKAKGENEPSVERYLDDDAFKTKVAGTTALTAIDVDHYDALFLPGGHGTMWDFPASTALTRAIRTFLDAGKPVASVCHGPAALTAVRDREGTPVVAGRQVSAFTDAEERAVGLDGAVPFLLETRLRELGATFVGAANFTAQVSVDRGLITGQNPQSSVGTADELLKALDAA